MKTGRGWWALAGVVAGPVLLLLASYVGAYYWTVRPARFTVEAANPVYRVPYWRHKATGFFGPIHKIDRTLRPDVWNPLPRP